MLWVFWRINDAGFQNIEILLKKILISIYSTERCSSTGRWSPKCIASINSSIVSAIKLKKNRTLLCGFSHITYKSPFFLQICVNFEIHNSMKLILFWCRFSKYSQTTTAARFGKCLVHQIHLRTDLNFEWHKCHYIESSRDRNARMENAQGRNWKKSPTHFWTFSNQHLDLNRPMQTRKI